MRYGESKLLRQEGSIRLILGGARYDRDVYYVLGNGPTKVYADYEDAYEDALEEFNLRWMREKFGE